MSAARPVTVARLRDEARDVRTFRLELGSEETLDFRPGQCMRIRFPGEEEWRDYSLSSAPPARGSFEITLSRAGRFTQRLFALRPGDGLTAEGPRGGWFYRDEGRPVALVSGGTGITPFKSLVEHLLARGLPHPVSLFHSARTPADIVFRRELDGYAGRGVKVVTTITRPREMAEGERWGGRVGRLSADLVEAETAGYRDAVFYLCGPGSLVRGLRDGLRARGIAAGRLRSEPWAEAA